MTGENESITTTLKTCYIMPLTLKTKLKKNF